MSSLLVLPGRRSEESLENGQVDLALILDDVAQARGHAKSRGDRLSLAFEDARDRIRRAPKYGPVDFEQAAHGAHRTVTFTPGFTAFH